MSGECMCAIQIWEDNRGHGNGKHYLFFGLDSLITSCMDFKQFRFTKTRRPHATTLKAMSLSPSQQLIDSCYGLPVNK